MWALADAVVDGIEYWFDDNSANTVSAALGPFAQVDWDQMLPTIAVPAGLHVFHIRFHGTGGWSSLLSRPFP